MTTDFGIDLATLADGDLDPAFGLSSGARLVAADVARRLQTEALFYADEGAYGFDLRELVASRTTRASIAVQVEEEALRDERVLDARVTVDGVRVALLVTTAEGPFRLVVDTSAAPSALAEEPL